MLEFTIRYWSARVPEPVCWREAGNAESSASQTPQLPALLRRRLSPLGRLAVSAALDLLPADAAVPIVFASRHGDAAKTLELLQSLARGEELSPTAFSLSVHNAVPGVLSIARGDISSITAIAAVNNLLLSTLFEAAAQLQEQPRVLCLLCDAPLPEFYGVTDDEISNPWALAFLLERSLDAEPGNETGDTRFLLTRNRDDAPGEAFDSKAPDTICLDTTLDLLPLLKGEVDVLALEKRAGGWVLVRRRVVNREVNGEVSHGVD